MVLKIEIPNYIREVQLSKKQRPIYYEWDGTTIKAKNKKLLQQYIDNPTAVKRNNGNVSIRHLKKEYYIGIVYGKILVGELMEPKPNGFVTYYISPKYPTFDQQKKEPKYILFERHNDTGKIRPVIANETKVGKPRMLIIKGQDFYSQAIPEHVRWTVINEIKRSFVPYLKNLPVIEEYPIMVTMEIHDTVKNQFDKSKNNVGIRWDVGNRAYPYGKAFLDLLATGMIEDKKVFKPKIIDDDRLHVTKDPQGGIFCPIIEGEEPKLVFIIETDTRDVIKNHYIYQIYHSPQRDSLYKRNIRMVSNKGKYPGTSYRGSTVEKIDFDF